LNFLLEITLAGVIIYLSYILHSQKKKHLNADSLKTENLLLKDQLTKKHLEFTSRELNLNQTIENLQISFTKEQEFLQEVKLDLDSKEKKLLLNISDLETKLLDETENRKKILSQKKSSEVRLGNIAETLAPFLDQFDFDPETCTFLGKPIDYISFGEEEITIIEVKSGKSQLNSKQRQIRDQIKAGLISWKEIRIK
jgi:predicted Holliday junction resolvase-like endonuclease